MPFISHRSTQSDFQNDITGGFIENHKCPNVRDEKTGFVMSYKDDSDLVKSTYPAYQLLEVDKTFKITEWERASHMYHGKAMGVDIKKYRFTSRELEKLRDEPKRYEGGGGLIAYARRGYKLPPIEMVHDFQDMIQEKCKKSDKILKNITLYDKNGKHLSTVFTRSHNENSKMGIIVAFNESSKEFITANRRRGPAFDAFLKKEYLGSEYWMTKYQETK